MKLLQISNYLVFCLRGCLKSVIIKDQCIICNVEKDRLLFVMQFFYYNKLMKCKSLLDVWALDYLNRDKRFEVNYLLLSLKNNLRICIKVNLEENEEIMSVNSYYKSAGWLEREVWDMFGIYFSGHKDLRRILSDYGFDGHPLRKDFPLNGYLEVRYDGNEKRIVMEICEMIQEFRYYNLISPWLCNN